MSTPSENSTSLSDNDLIYLALRWKVGEDTKMVAAMYSPDQIKALERAIRGGKAKHPGHNYQFANAVLIKLGEDALEDPLAKIPPSLQELCNTGDKDALEEKAWEVIVKTVGMASVGAGDYEQELESLYFELGGEADELDVFRQAQADSGAVAFTLVHKPTLTVAGPFETRADAEAAISDLPDNSNWQVSAARSAGMITAKGEEWLQDMATV